MLHFEFTPGGPRLSRIGFGTWPLDGRDWGSSDERDGIAAIHAALDLGITVFDTAPAYGPERSEVLLGQALEGRRDRAFVATKCGIRWDAVRYRQDLTPASIREECEASLRRLRTDRIDLYQIHWPHAATPLEESLQAMLDLRSAGKILHLGVSNFTPPELRRAIDLAEVRALQPPYHLFMRGIEEELLPLCRAEAVRTFVYGTLCKGLLSGKWLARPIPDDIRRKDPFFGSEMLPRLLPLVAELVEVARDVGCTGAQLAIAYALTRPGIDCALVGTRHPAQIEETSRAADLALSDSVLARIDDILAQAPRVV